MWETFVTYVRGNASAMSAVSSTSRDTLSNLGVVKGEGLHLCEGLGFGFQLTLFVAMLSCPRCLPPQVEEEKCCPHTWGGKR